MKIFTLLIVFMAAGFATANAQNTPPQKPISAGVLNGKAISLPKPVYPEDARKAKLAATVTVNVVIDENGTIVSAEAIDGLEFPSLRQAAEAAARLARFSPTLLAGQPIRVSGVIVYHFVGQSNEERLHIFGISAFLALSRAFAADIGKLREIFEGEDPFPVASRDYPEFTPELSPLKTFDQMTPVERIATIDKVRTALQSRSQTPSDRWQFDAGGCLGNVIGPIFLHFGQRGSRSKLSKIEESTIRLNLQKLNEMTRSAPADFPPDVLEKLKAVAADSEMVDLAEDKDLQDLFSKILDLISTISPDVDKEP